MRVRRVGVRCVRVVRVGVVAVRGVRVRVMGMRHVRVVRMVGVAVDHATLRIRCGIYRIEFNAAANLHVGGPIATVLRSS